MAYPQPPASGTTVSLGMGATVTISPNVSAAAYAAGQVVAGVCNVTSILNQGNIGLLQSAQIKFSGSVQTSEIDLYTFNAFPAAGTYNDHAAPTWSATDNAALVDVFPLTATYSGLGTQTIYTLNSIWRFIQGASQALYVVPIIKSATSNNFASTTEFSLTLGAMW